MTNITKEQFERYLEVQRSGEYNMVSGQAMIATGLDRNEYTYILQNYNELLEKYKDN